jgi:hypothetical protein
MRLVKKQPDEQAASDALLLTAEIIKDVGLSAEYLISTASNDQPARQQLVVTCVGESGVSCCCCYCYAVLPAGVACLPGDFSEIFFHQSAKIIHPLLMLTVSRPSRALCSCSRHQTVPDHTV